MNTEKSLQTAEPKKILIPYQRVSDLTQATENKTGLKRQYESAYRTLASHPTWEIDETFHLIDPGLSGYHGKNLDPEAALGGFLKMLKEGKIPLTPTRALHIDDMSRLSRMNLRRATRLFEDILESGVEIYDAEDSKLYTKESLDDEMDSIIRILRQGSSHKFSKNLADKVSKSFAIRKQYSKDTGKPYRYKSHGWLKWVGTSATEGYYGEVAGKVPSLKRIFALGDLGLGVRGITTRLNEEPEKYPITSNYKGKKVKSKKWTTTSVRRIIMSQAVIGLNENLDPPVKMFPVIIDPKLYWRVRGKIETRRQALNHFCGRNVDSAENLFSGLTECIRCQGSMNFHKQKGLHWKTKTPEAFGSRGGAGSHGGIGVYPYFICSTYTNGPCTAKQIRYDWTEESFVTAISCSVASLTLADSKKPVADGKDTEMLKGQLAEARALLGKYTDVNTEVPTKAGAIMIKNQEDEETRLQAELESATMLEATSTPVGESRKALLTLMYSDWNAKDTRLKARELIRSMVEKMVFDLVGQSYVIHWKGISKPTRIEILKRGAKLKGYNIDGTFYPSMGREWKKATADIARYAKEAEAEPLPA